MIKHLALAIVLGGGCFFHSSAQGYYDDDIYYNASKAKKEKQEATKKAAEKVAAANYVPNKSVDFPAADSYTVTGSSTRDVDEYNRHIKSSSKATSTTGALDDDNTFAYTRQIEKFRNPSIVEGSNDETLQYLYYTNEAQREQKNDFTEVNIYLNSPWGWDSWWPYYSSWNWGPAWSWNNWYWNSWYGPSWSWGWNWGPSWSWNGWYGPSWSWGGWVGPSWGWSGPGWGAPAPPYRPAPPAAPGRGNFVRHNQYPAGYVGNPQPGQPGANGQRHSSFNPASSRRNTILQNTVNNSRYSNGTTGLRPSGTTGTGTSRQGTGARVVTNTNNRSTSTGTRYNSNSSTSRHNTGSGFSSGGGGSRNTGGGGGGRGRH